MTTSPLSHFHSLYRAWLNEFVASANVANVIYAISILLICLVVSVLFYKVGKWLIFRGTELFIQRRNSRTILALKRNRFFSYLSYYLPLLVFKFNFDALFMNFSKLPVVLTKLYEIIAIVLLVLIINSILNTIVDLNKTSKHSKPIRGLLQFLQIVIYFIAGIFCISILIDKSPTALVAGLGAASAIIMLIFKDSITSLVAGVQLSFNHMLRIGDWVSLPKYNVDGEIYDITLTSVKIRNWDKSVSMVPTYNLIANDSVTNWRYMKDFGARRISRSIIVDIHTVQFCTPEMLERYRQIEGVNEALRRVKMLDDVPTSGAIINTQSLTNIGVMRAYALYYLENKKEIRKDLDIMVRQRGHLLNGLPLEVYCFTNTTETKVYENIQSDIFDHLIAVAPLFDLKLFQSAVATA